MALYRFAELNVEMAPQEALLTARALDYLAPTSGKADICLISPTLPQAVAGMRRTRPGLSAEQCEYLIVGSLFYRELLRYEGMMLHASAVALDGRAYLFSAPPGTGKSTHAAGWLRHFGDRAFIINDDKPAIRRINGVCCACGTPFSGKEPLSRDACVPIAGICALTRGSENRITRLTAKQAFPLLLEQTVHRRLSPTNMNLLLETMQRLLTEIPLWRLECTIGPDAVRVAYEAMSDTEQKG